MTIEKLSPASVERARARFTERLAVPNESGCRFWMGGIEPNGYGYVTIGSRADGTRQKIKTHRLAWELERGPIPLGLFVLHSCDQRNCCAIEHLHLGTHEENMREMVDRGRALDGEKSKHAVLTDEKAEAIRALRAAGWGATRIAKLLGANRGTVRNVIDGTTWTHLLRVRTATSTHQPPGETP